MRRVYTPIHADPNLNDGWWLAKGMKVGDDIYYNAIRDGSGRYDGYLIMLNRELYKMTTVEEAEQVLALRDRLLAQHQENKNVQTT